MFCDIDGTLAPIVERASDAAIDEQARGVLAALAERYALVGCVSGRSATEAARLVGVEGLVYIGNHGFERLLPGAPGAELDPLLRGHEQAARGFLEQLDASRLEDTALRTEDKGPIQAIHWRGAPDEAAAEASAREIAAEAAARNLVPHWGRKVLEIRPPVDLNKGTAVAELLAEAQISHAIYGGDDRTDVDAFRRLRDLARAGELRTAVCVGITSAEGPPEIREEADVLAEGPDGFVELLRTLVA